MDTARQLYEQLERLKREAKSFVEDHAERQWDDTDQSWDCCADPALLSEQIVETELLLSRLCMEVYGRNA